MFILFDHGTPKGLARALAGHMIITAQERGWDKLNNGLLLNAAEEAAFDLFLTTDRRIRYQQREMWTEAVKSGRRFQDYSASVRISKSSFR